jgi:hypothetical protein
MSEPGIDKSALPDPSYHWTTFKAGVFLGALADLGSVARAAREVGMSRQSAYRLRERLGPDSVFSRVWNEAQGAGLAKRRARKRANTKATPLAPERDIFGIGR